MQAALCRGRRRCAASTTVGQHRGVRGRVAACHACARGERGVAGGRLGGRARSRGPVRRRACSRARARGPAAGVRRGRHGLARRAPCARAHGQTGAARAAWAGEVAASGVRGSGAGGRGAGLPCSVGACGRGGAELVRPGRSPGGGACSGEGCGRVEQEASGPAERAGRKRGEKGRKEKRKGKRKWKKEKWREREGEREIRAEITASIAEPVGRVPRSPACADEATGKRGRNAGDWLIGTGKDSGN